jgi:hypothetical protein
MPDKKEDKRDKGRVVDVAERRRHNRAGQKHHNPEEPSEEGQPVNPTVSREPEEKPRRTA